MHVILITSLFGERSGNPGDLLPVADQAEADELVKAGFARHDPDAPAAESAPKRKGRA